MRETSNLLGPVAVESGMMPPPGFQIYLRPRMSLTFDPWTSKLIVSLLAAIGVKIAVTGRNAPHSRQKNRAVYPQRPHFHTASEIANVYTCQI